jgi:DNA repair protein RadC
VECLPLGCTARPAGLAIVDNLATNHFVDRARNKARRLFSPSDGICNNAGGKLISTVDDFNHWNTQSSAAVAAERQRSVLEELLASVAPRDAASMSAALIKEFSSLSRVFGESKEALQRIVGDSSKIADLLQAAQSALVESLHSEIHLILISRIDQRLIDYLVASMAPYPIERLRILFLDRGNRLIGDEIMATGSLTTLTAHPRNIFKRAFELSASAILLVHNHPGGSIEPSACDIEFTKKLISLGNALEIEVKDHIVIAGTRWLSFMKQGLL